MEIIKKAKNAVVKMFTGRQDKLDIILDMIESISVNPETNMVHIKTSKNIAIENDGHTVIVSSGVQVLFGKEIHFNPKIEFSDKNFEELTPRLDEARRIEQEETQKLIEESKDQMFCNH